MKNSTKEKKKPRSIAEASLNNNPQMQQALAQIEATISRKEYQKVTEKSGKI